MSNNFLLTPSTILIWTRKFCHVEKIFRPQQANNDNVKPIMNQIDALCLLCRSFIMLLDILLPAGREKDAAIPEYVVHVIRKK